MQPATEFVRVQISKKIRFEVFKRDGFSCQYCGSTPPAVVLEVDHVVPVSDGGSNAMDNLLTSCFDCNRGKSDRSLDSIPESLSRKAEILVEKEAQIRAYKRLQKKIAKRIAAEVDDVNAVFQSAFPSRELTENFRQQIADRFLSKLPVEDVVGAMRKAIWKCSNPSAATKYFCGICWRRIRGEYLGPL